MYKDITFLRARKYDNWSLYHRAIDWIEEKGVLKPGTVIIKPQPVSDSYLEGRYDPKYGRMYLYRGEPETMELALVHELIHHWQWDGLTYKADEAFKLDISPSGKRYRYLADPTEVEAYWYMNEYSREHYSREIPQVEEYRDMGIHLSNLYGV